ncbi:DUF4249 domain-containing protein [Hymenobacter lucidus]|uniref:DUF4249 domain-containing protein n=1 Tax=Hymenobacter lucidus TaxID=2880930 RepID=A0ABS8AV67_9BACT|nr:DUF4249 domain-containing protein [Hymenobacter lucidus]MCB2409639.1 DUF4249 domain-containing protein [Hymenobacter lucidus]
MSTFSTITTTTKLAALLLLGLGTGACETTIDLPEPAHTPKVALQYVLSNYADQGPNDEVSLTRQLYVSNSQRVFDTRELNGRTDAKVDIRDESGTVVERFKESSSAYQGGYYEPTMGLKAQPGRTYTLRATVPGLPAVESTVTLPAAPIIESATFTEKPNPNNVYDTRGQLSVTIADDPNTDNYYIAFARIVDSQGNVPDNWSPVQIDEENSDVSLEVGRFQLSNLGGFSGYGYGFYPYADTNVNGKRFSLTSNVRFYAGYCPTPGNCPKPGYMEVFISALTRDAYNFYLSRQRYNDTEGNPFAEPAPLVSNIKGGYGLFGGITDAVYRIKL